MNDKSPRRTTNPHISPVSCSNKTALWVDDNFFLNHMNTIPACKMGDVNCQHHWWVHWERMHQNVILLFTECRVNIFLGWRKFLSSQPNLYADVLFCIKRWKKNNSTKIFLQSSITSRLMKYSNVFRSHSKYQ